MLIPEFSPQSGVALTWPHARTDWRDSLDEIVPVYIEMARAIVAAESLLVICYDEAHRTTVTHRLDSAGVPMDNIRFACVPTNDTWVRDYGPLATSGDNAPVLHDFTFNGWDNKYPAALDNTVSRTLHAEKLFGDLQLQQHSLVLEGGSLESDGHGTLLTTARCLLETGRNPDIDRAAMETILCDVLGMEQVLWLEHGEIMGDDTDGHIDMLVRCCPDYTIAYSTCASIDDPHYTSLAAMAAQLDTFTNAAGQPFRLVALPLPEPCHGEDNQRLPASYANFLILNDTVLMPAYNDPADTVAALALQSCFPGRNIVPINCLPLVTQGGSLHCAALQLPAGVLSDGHE